MAIRVQIDGYDSLEQIGVGGMAAVYKARKMSIDKTVAIKVLFPYLATDASFTERFQREAKAAASIQHENIVNVVDFGESEGSFYIVMEYYQGRTLEELMKVRPGVPFDVAAQVVLEVAYGLEAAHHMDIVHRDIKPANVIFTDSGGIKVADFGLAKKSDSMTMITQQGKVIGTPAYMSPEQAAGRPVGTASDIFSLGVVAYELFGRRKPFEGKSYSDVLEKIQTFEPPAVTNVNPIIEADFAAIIGRMLEKNDRDRYPNASALVADLETAMEKAKITRDRRRLASYIKDPNAYDAAFLEKTVTNCLSRGSFFMQKGQHHMEDAALEFRRILFLDPTNERARKNLDRINSQRGGPNRTVSINAAPPATRSSASPATRTVTPRTVQKQLKTAPRWSRWAMGAGAVVVAAVAVVAWLGTQDAGVIAPSRSGVPSTSSMADATSNDVAVGVRDNATVRRPVATDSSVAADSLAQRGAGSDKPKRASATKSSSDAPGEGAVVASNKPKDTSRTATEKPKEQREADASGTKPATQDVATSKGAANEPARSTGEGSRAVAKPAEGTLSVFFLGGVGEVLVNGKRFDHQPPFEGVNLPVGTYRIACRMSGDTKPKEIVVAIRSNQATVVEYELGSDPVVVTE